MRLRISLSPAQPVVLPVHYNRLVQAAIYGSLDQVTAAFLHDHGFSHGARTFRLFTFSRLLGPYEIDRQAGEIAFRRGAVLVVSSPWEDFCGSLATCLLATGFIDLRGREVPIGGVEVLSPRVTEDSVTVATLSPIVVYSTLSKGDGTKYTCYFQPGEPEFAEQIARNLEKKYEMVEGRPASVGPMEIKAITQPRLNIVKYAGTVIKGYSCTLRMTGPPALLQVGLDAGLGAKNSQGFGCIDLRREGRVRTC